MPSIKLNIHTSHTEIAMDSIVVLLIYFGAASAGVALFGEGGFAAWFAVIVGGLGINWLINNQK